MSPPRAFLDACVLFPPLVRGLLLHAAAQNLHDPAWSPRVIEEWARATARDHGEAAGDAVRAEAALMANRWPDALTEPDPQNLAQSLPDEDDVHVLAAALTAKADLLVTFNLRDFPAPKLRRLGLAPISPDAFLWELAGRSPVPMARAIAAALAPFPGLQGPQDIARALKRAHVPRLAKMIRTGALTLETPCA